MINRTLFAGILIFLSWIGIREESRSQPTAQKGVDFTKIERVLKSAPIVSVDKESLMSGRNAPWIVVLDDKKTGRRAVFKYIHRIKPIALRSSYKFELAAYELDKLLSCKKVPPVVERMVDDRTGALQLMMEDVISEADRKQKRLEPPDQIAFERALEDISVFDALTACQPGNLDDILIDLADWRICRVDFSEAFSTSAVPSPEKVIRGCSRTLYQRLLKLDREKIEMKLDQYLSEEEINALLVRKKTILDQLKKRIKEKGESAVLF